VPPAPPAPPEPTIVHTPARHAPSEHAVPSGAFGFVHAPLAGTQVPATWHSSLAVQVTAGPATQVPLASQLSAPSQRSASAHDVPAVTGVCVTPVVAPQTSSVQGFSSSRTSGVPGTHAPTLHSSAPLQTSPSEHETAFGAFTQPLAALHESSVHTLPSLQFGAVPAWHDPPPHTSAPLQALPSEHETVFGAFTQPLAGLHVSSVHTLPSLQFGAVPAWHDPPPHTSAPLQALPSEHETVFGAFTQPLAALHESSVHTLPSLQFGAVPAWHDPPPHTSAPLQAFPSEHEPVTLFVWQVPVALQVSASSHAVSLELPQAEPGGRNPASTHVPVPLHASSARQSFGS
jgi:hypothetical protein